jgi:antitoxin YefM
MRMLNFSETRQKLKYVMDRVVRDHVPVVVARKSGESVVIVSLADWNAQEETAYLLSHKANAERLGEAVRELDAAKGSVRKLTEP